MARKGKVKVIFQVVRDGDDVKRNKGKDEDGQRYLTVHYLKSVVVEYVDNTVSIDIIKPKDITPTGFIEGKATNGDTNSFQVFGKMGLKALKDGNSDMVITQEGHHRRVEADGWGVGTHVTGGTISDSGSSSIVGHGGTGYSSDKVGTEDYPWLHGYVGMSK